MTKSIACSLAQATMASTSVALMGTHWATWAMPPLPGAQYSSVTLGTLSQLPADGVLTAASADD